MAIHQSTTYIKNERKASYTMSDVICWIISGVLIGFVVSVYILVIGGY
jgi:hypothetical protein